MALIAREPLQTIERNIYPTQLLLDELCRRHQAGQPLKFFLASTSEVYGKNPKPIWTEEDDLVFGPTTRPRWSYGASKAIDEFLTLACARQFGLPVVIGRFFNVVGPRQTGAYGMVLPRFVDAALAGQPLVVHDDGRQIRCFAHVDDVVAAVLALMQTPAAIGQVFNIGSDQPVTILRAGPAGHRAGRLDIADRIPELHRRLRPGFRRHPPPRARPVPPARRRSAISRSYDLAAIMRDVIAWKRQRTSAGNAYATVPFGSSSIPAAFEQSSTPRPLRPSHSPVRRATSAVGLPLRHRPL